MAAQTQDARVVLQPTQQEAPLQTNVFAEGAQSVGQAAAVAGQESRQQESMAGRYGQIAQQHWGRAVNLVSSAFDQAISSYNELAVENAKKEAPAAITKDADGMVVAPSTFWPSGFHSMAYAKAYKQAYEATYVQSAVADHEQYSALQKAKFSADPAGYANAMKTRRAAAMSGLDPDMAPFVDLRLQQVEGQGTTQIGVNLQAQKNEVMKKNAELEIDSIIDTASRSPGVMNALPSGTGAFATIEERVANDAMLGKRWAGVAAQLTQAGYSPEFIARTRQEMGFRIGMAQKGREIRDGVAVDRDRGVVPGEIIAGWQRGIWDWAAQYPGREAAIIQHLNADLQSAVSQSSRIAAGIQLGLEKKQQTNERNDRVVAAIADDPGTSEEERKYLRDSLRLRTLDTLTNPNIPDNIALRQATSAQQAGALSNQAYAQTVNTRLVGLRDLATNPESTPVQREQADRELRTILASPDLQTALTAEQQSFARQTIAAGAVRRIGGNLNGAMIEAAQGNLRLTDAAEIVRVGTANGSIGNHQGAAWDMQTAQRFLATAATSELTRTTNDNLLGSAARARQQGRPLTTEEAAVVEKEKPFRPSGPPGTVLDMNNEQHQQDVAAYIDKWQIAPKQLTQAFDALPRGEDPAKFEPFNKMFNTLMNTAKGLGYPEREQQIAQVLKWTGPKGYFILDAQDRGLDKAAAAVVSDAATSKTAQQGGPTQQSDQGLSSKIDGVVNELSTVYANSGALAKIKQFSNPFSSTDDEKRSALFFGDYSQPRAPDEPVRQTPTSVTISDDVRAEIAGKAAGIKDTNGKVITRLKLGGDDVDKWSIGQAFSEIADKIERLPNPKDPTNAIVQYKSFNSTMRDTLKVPALDKGAERGVALGVLAARDQGPNAVWQPYDRNSVRYDPVRNPGGEMIWRVTAMGNNGMPIWLTDMKQDDKALTGLTSQLMRTAAQEADKWAGLFGGKVDPATGKPTVETSTFLGQLFAEAVTNPLSKMARDNKVLEMARAQGKIVGWEDSFIDLVRTVKSVYQSATGEVPTQMTDKDAEALRETIRKMDDSQVAQIKRFGLLHYLFRATPDMSLDAPVGEPSVKGKGTTSSQPSSGPPRNQQRIPSNFQPYQPYDYTRTAPSMPPRLEGWDLSGNR